MKTNLNADSKAFFPKAKLKRILEGQILSRLDFEKIQGAIGQSLVSPSIKNDNAVCSEATHFIPIKPDIKLGHLCEAYLKENPYALIENRALRIKFNQFLNKKT